MGNPLFPSIFASISCLVTIVETDASDEVLKVVDMLHHLSMPEKYLILIASTLNKTSLENMTINFQLTVHDKDKGLIIQQFTPHMTNEYRFSY